MKITKSQLKQIIQEELQQAVQEQKDPKKLEASGKGMAMVVGGLTAAMSEVQGGGLPPEIMIEGTPIFDWFAAASGYSKQEITAVARKKKVIVQ